ncbi:hypothetical protein WN51_13026 [Melipona quadrifasciata]|uniref:Uncharacterized protein n=1 Tax=Melipona quadrifasciata TaxID=166423 RepID=A0A0N0BKG2_9HYME|nr:hypothetical protein WN51_13026 [Melipona quadrifasciata]
MQSSCIPCSYQGMILILSISIPPGTYFRSLIPRNGGLWSIVVRVFNSYFGDGSLVSVVDGVELSVGWVSWQQTSVVVFSQFTPAGLRTTSDWLRQIFNMMKRTCAYIGKI